MMISATTAARMISAIFDIPPSKGYCYAVAPTGPRSHRRGLLVSRTPRRNTRVNRSGVILSEHYGTRHEFREVYVAMYTLGEREATDWHWL